MSIIRRAFVLMGVTMLGEMLSGVRDGRHQPKQRQKKHSHLSYEQVKKQGERVNYHEWN